MRSNRREFLKHVSSLVLAGGFGWGSSSVFAQDNRLEFSELYAGYSALGLKFSEKLTSLNGKTVTIRGFMAPPLKAEASFFILTKQPVSLCPFCDSDADWPDDIILVRLAKDQPFVQNNRLIEVTGTLEVGSKTDEETGFVSLVRLVQARFEVL
ncbi:MAG: twin-arginine translocation signal domain-containing protein [Sutterellaceae bacterium]|nr:twin-arginine translocation signal domain-containing protein [Sutterellaceae bacterium]